MFDAKHLAVYFIHRKRRCHRHHLRSRQSEYLKDMLDTTQKQIQEAERVAKADQASREKRKKTLEKNITIINKNITAAEKMITELTSQVARRGQQG